MYLDFRQLCIVDLVVFGFACWVFLRSMYDIDFNSSGEWTIDSFRGEHFPSTCFILLGGRGILNYCLATMQHHENSRLRPWHLLQ
jgi:hypothetical protein